MTSDVSTGDSRVRTDGPGADGGWLTREAAEDFLYREAALLDEWQLDAWVGLFTEDGRYVIPSNDHALGDPARDLVLVDDDIVRLRARAVRLNSRKAHREYPHANTSHQVSNVTVLGCSDDEAQVRALFTVWRFRDGSDDHYVGRYDYRLRNLGGGQTGIVRKRATMAMTTLRPAGAVSILL